jgi:hypothetical protein
LECEQKGFLLHSRSSPTNSGEEAQNITPCAVFSKGSDEKSHFFLSESAIAVFTSGSGGCQTANGIKATKGSDYAGLTLD